MESAQPNALVTIILEYQKPDLPLSREKIENLRMNLINNQMSAVEIINILKQYGFPIHNSQLFFKDQEGVYNLIGKDPLKGSFMIPYMQQLTLKIKHSAQSMSVLKQELKQEQKEEEDIPVYQLGQGLSRVRAKEGIVKNVLQKVNAWRQLHESKELDYESAAKEVGVNKKTLDEYLQQIKKGKIYNFKFKDHMNEKIGVLRCFNRCHDQARRLLNTGKLSENDIIKLLELKKRSVAHCKRRKGRCCSAIEIPQQVIDSIKERKLTENNPQLSKLLIWATSTDLKDLTSEEEEDDGSDNQELLQNLQDQLYYPFNKNILKIIALNYINILLAIQKLFIHKQTQL